MSKIAVIMKVWNESDLIENSIRQWYDVPIDAFFLFDEGCTDRTISKARHILKNLKCETNVIKLSPPHEQYFYRCQEDEYKHLQTMVDIASDYDWVFKIDTDEVLTTVARMAIEWIKRDVDPRVNAFYSEVYEIQYGLDKYQHKLIDNSGKVVFDHNLHRSQIRCFKPEFWCYPDLKDQDTYPHAKKDGAGYGKIAGFDLIHLKSLILNRRHIRGNTLKNQFKMPNETAVEYAPIDRRLIPDWLVEWCDFNVNLVTN